MARARTLGVIVDRMTSLAEQRAARPTDRRRPRSRRSIAASNGNGKHERGTQQAAARRSSRPPCPVNAPA